MKPIISIIIPIYRAEKWLSRCIESVINQSYTNLDIILINDGSPDNSGEVCDEYALKDIRITVIHKENEGPSIARNMGLGLAKGEYIQFVDSDDWLDKDACKILIENMISEDVDQVVCGLNVIREGKIIRKPYLPKRKLTISKNSNDFFYLYKILASPCNKLYKKLYIKENFDTSTSMGEDLRFNIEYIKNVDKTLTIERCLYNVCLDNEESLNRKFQEDRLDRFLETQKKVFDFCNSSYGDQYDKTILYNLTVLGVHAHFRNVCKNMDKRKAIKIINNYKNNKDIIQATMYAKHKRKDYILFNALLKTKQTYSIYYYFIIKFTYVKIKFWN